MSNEYSSIDCDEVYGTRSEQASIEGGLSASVQLKVSAANKDALIDDLLGNQREYPNFNAITKPRAYQAAAVPQAVDQATPVAASSQRYTYQTYLVTVSYTSDPVRTIYSEIIEPSVEFSRLDHRFFRWSSGEPLAEGEAPGKLEPMLRLVKRFYNRLLVPTAIITYPGYVHSGVHVSSLGFVFPTETLLFLPDPVERTVTTAGSSGFNYSTSFKFKPQGWNKYWRPSTQSYEEIELPNGSTYKSYPATDLNSILV